MNALSFQGNCMDHNVWDDEEEEWVIWNGSYGIVDTVSLGHVEGLRAQRAWLAEPYDMVGPFNLDELVTNGQIDFAACSVMSRQRWSENQVRLRQESLQKRREDQKRIFEELAKANRNRRRHASYPQAFDEKSHRQLLDLPMHGELKASQIKRAYRSIAKKAHPDVGGSHEIFVKITAARNALLECFS
jgi:hypothetical protein